MTENKTSPNSETKAAEADEAESAHQADRPATAEEAKAAPTSTKPETKKDFDEMSEIGANVKGEGEVP